MILVVSPAAARDLDELWGYLATEADEGTADRVIDVVAARCELLAAVPLAGRVRRELGEGVRSLVVEHHVIYYRVEEHAVVVARVLHERRDQAGTFLEAERADDEPVP